jgi:hypothetical protein
MKFFNTVLFISFINTYLIAQDKALSIVAPVRVLYINGVNDLQVLIPNLKTEDNIKYEVKGAQLIKGTSKTEIKLIPSDTLVELKVFKNSILYKKNEFKAIKIPLPKMNVYVNDSILDFVVGAKASSLKRIQLRLLPDEWVTNNLPKEVKYFIGEFKISLVRGRNLVYTKIFTTDSIDFPLPSDPVKSMDRLVIEVKSIKRMNYKNEEEDIPLNRITIVPLF